MDAPTPRVSSRLLGQYIGQVVRISGKVISLAQDAIIETADGGQVTVVQAPDNPKIADTFVEVIAKVESEERVRELDCSNFGDKYDLTLARAVVDIVHNPALSPGFERSFQVPRGVLICVTGYTLALPQGNKIRR